MYRMSVKPFIPLAVVSLSLLVPEGAGAQEVVPDFSSAEFFNILGRIASFIYWVALWIFVIMAIVGAIFLVTGAGDATRIARGKKTLLWAGIGLVLVLVATGVVPVVRDLLGT